MPDHRCPMADGHRSLSTEDLLTFALEGCNAAEVAAFAGVSESTAKAMLANARTAYARGLAQPASAAPALPRATA